MENQNQTVTDASTRRIITALLRRAHLSDTGWDAHVLTGMGVTNAMWRVTTVDDRVLIARIYGWPHEGQDPLDRVRKEPWLHRMLAERDVPVAAILSSWSDIGASAVLMDFLPGSVLGDVTAELSTENASAAWSSTGQALARAHRIQFEPGVSGWITGEQVTPFSQGSWGAFVIEEALRHGQRLVDRGLEIDLGAVRHLMTEVRPELDRVTMGLLHNDLHAWNVLVDQSEVGWCCSGWLDWEYAMVGDPVWDLVRMDVFRLKPIGATPQAFYDGYGDTHGQRFREIYEMSILLWLADEYLDGVDAGEPDSNRTMIATYRMAMAYAESFPDHLPEMADSWHE